MTRARDVATQGGLVLLSNASFTNAVTVTVDNVFSSTYDNYKVLITATGANNGNRMRLTYIDAGGTEYTSIWGGLQSSDYWIGSGLSQSISNGSFWPVMWLNNGSNQRSFASLEISNPFLSTVSTTGVGLHTGINNGSAWAGGFSNSMTDGTNSLRGFRLSNTSSGNMTGAVRVYGIKN